MRLEKISQAQYALLIVTVMLVVVFINTRDTDVQAHNRAIGLVLQLQQADGELDRLVQAAAGLQLVEYDPFVLAERRSRRLLAQIDSLAQAHGDGFLTSGIDAYRKVFEEKMRLAERLKSRAALLRNGLHYLPLAVAELQKDTPSLGGRLARLLNDYFRYKLFPGRLEVRSIKSRLDVIELFSEPDGETRERLENIIAHMRANLVLIENIQQLESEYVDLPGRQRLDDIYQLEVDDFADRTRRSEMLSLLLMCLSILLLASLGFVLRRLATARRQAERAWHQLHDAVESLSEAFALYAKDGSLVLHNRRFLEFYPWLRDAAGAEITLAKVQSLNKQSGRVTETGGDAGARGDWYGARSYVEQLKDGRWFLASDSMTSAGETACVRVDITESKRSEEELRKLYRALEQSPASVVITDTQGNIEYVNPKFEEITGYRSEEVLGQNPRILKSGDKTAEDYKEMWDTIISGRVWRGQFHNKRKDGAIFWESASISPVRGTDGEITHFIAVKEDITAQKRAEDQLRLNATVFETTTEGIVVTDAETRIKTVNPAFTRITGYTSAEAVGRKTDMLSSGRHDKAFYEAMWHSLQAKGYWSGEIWNRRKDGSVFPEWLSVAAISETGGVVTEYVAVFSDITRRKMDEEQIRRQANFDALTGLPNRALLVDRLERAINSATRENWSVALLFIDLDRFKVVNDTLGHVIGDELLQKVAERLRDCVRQTDTVARFGGDEFVVVLEDIKQADDAAEISKKIIHSLDREFELAGRSVYIGASIGISLYPEDAEDADTMLRNADMAMYRAKDSGRNSYQFFTLSMNAQVHQRMELERDLRLAMERGELSLRYQPIMRISDDSMPAVEALLCWQHPQRGIVSTPSFIPLAEDTGLIGPIGRWVLQEACRQAARWREGGLDVRMHVNLSSRQLSQGLSVEEIEATLRQTKLPAANLELEITEGLMLEGEESTLEWLRQVRELGVGLAVDDFGTGYSSLSYLKRFPMDTLKIDRAFIKGIPEDQDDASLVRAIMAMAESLGLEVVAEGVETPEQLSFLSNLGCGQVQGYLYSRPVWPVDLTQWLGSRQKSGDQDKKACLTEPHS